jgi:hypothetical protein
MVQEQQFPTPARLPKRRRLFLLGRGNQFMSRKQRTTIRRKNYRAWKQEHKQDSRPPSIAKPIDDNAPSSAHEPIDQAALIHELRSPHISSDEREIMRDVDIGDPLFDEAPQPPPAPVAPGHSTGPRTAAGLARSSQNARKHGLSSLTSIFVMMTGEDPHEWVQLVDDLNQEFQPATRTERILVNDMAQSHWLTQRAINLQTSHIEDPKFLALYLRYQTTHHRAYYRALKQLLTLQQTRTKKGEKPVFYPKLTTQQIQLEPAPSGAGSPDPRSSPQRSRMHTSGFSNAENSQPQAA